VEGIISGKYGSALTSDYVFDETVTVVLVRTKSLESAVNSGKLIRESVTLVSVSESIFEHSSEIFNKQKSTRFSFTDCTILALIAENHIDKLATFDKEFRGADFYKVVN
jgi:predicted nucleic acid-binding protein